MGRKIPAKKHHGVKDPEKQAEQRNAKIKMKINETPANIDDQEIPKKIKNLFKPTFKRKKGPTHDNPPPASKGKSKNEIDKHQPQRPVKKTPNFQRIPGESDRDYLWRTELVTRNYLKKTRFEDKYDVDVETDDRTGEVDIRKRDMKFIEDGIKVEPKDKWEKKKFKKMEKLQKEREERKQLKKEKFKMRKLHMKNKKLGKQDEFSVLKQDKVEFGDVAQQPPHLTAKPRKSSATEKVSRSFHFFYKFMTTFFMIMSRIK